MVFVGKFVEEFSRRSKFSGCNVVRDPPDSTERYVRWANQLTDEDLTIDVSFCYSNNVEWVGRKLKMSSFDFLGSSSIKFKIK